MHERPVTRERRLPAGASTSRMSVDPSPTVTEHRHPGPAVEIVSAGNEVLIGDVLDTNTNWLCRRVTGLGGWVRRTVMVRDVVDDVAAEYAAPSSARRRCSSRSAAGAHRRRPARWPAWPRPPAGHWSCTPRPSDGRGSTGVRCPGLRAVRRMNEARRKMARLPRGRQPIVNPSAAPRRAARDRRHRHRLAAGRARRAQGHRRRSRCDDLFARIFGSAHYEERIADGRPAGRVGDRRQTARRAGRHPGVYMKSRAKMLGSTRVIRVTCRPAATTRWTTAAAPRRSL